MSLKEVINFMELSGYSRVNLICKIDSIIADVMLLGRLGLYVSSLNTLRYTNICLKWIGLDSRKKHVSKVREYNICESTDIHDFSYTVFNPYYYDIIAKYNIKTLNISDLHQEIDTLYDRLSSKVDIYRYRNDYDSDFTYLK